MNERFHLIPVKLTRIKSKVRAHNGEHAEKEEDSSIAGGIVNWNNNSGNKSRGSQKIGNKSKWRPNSTTDGHTLKRFLTM